jgi:kexin
LDEAEGLGWQRSNVDVVSCSWGPQDDGSRMEAPGRLVQEVFERGVREGRGGKGTIFVWAGGNGAEYGDNCNYDAYANDFRTISVSAVDSNNKPAWYSEPCAMHLVTAPSSGLYSNGVSTDMLHGQCTTRFGGTSAAAPMIAGAVANVLQVNPELRWRDIQALIAKTAKKVPGFHDDWSSNARGYHHSHHFGFGYLNLPETVEVARGWKHLPPMVVCHTRVMQIAKPIPQNGNGDGPLVHPIIVVPSDQCMSKIDFIESVGLRMYIRHPRRGQVSVRLRDPEGTVSILAEERGDYHSDYPADGWLFGSVRHFGARPYGAWRITVYDTVPDHNRGSLQWVELIVRGHKESH